MKPMARILLALALGCTMALPMSQPLAGDVGRNYSRCVDACNFIRHVCEDRCDNDCAVLYPNDPPQRQACVSTCHELCRVQQSDCKAFCLAAKKGEISPPEP